MIRTLLLCFFVLLSSSTFAQKFDLKDSHPYYSANVQTDYRQNIGIGFEVGVRGIESPLSFSVAGSISSLNSSIYRNSFYLLQGKVGYRLTKKPEADTWISIRAIGSPMISRDRFTCAIGGRISYNTPSGTEYSIEPLVDAGGHFYLGLAIAMLDLSPRKNY